MTFQINIEEGLQLRYSYLNHARRIVVKVGSAVLTGDNGLDIEVISSLASEIGFLMAAGKEVILVSSGAVAAGKRRLAVDPRRDLPLKEKQAIAAVGQSSLMRAYEDVFDRQGRKVAQVLLTHDDLSERVRYLNVRNTILTLLSWKILPIINENDTVSVQELRFGDNDTLGAMISNVIDADMFVCLTDVDGLYTGNPHVDKKASQVYTVMEVDQVVEDMAGHVFGALGQGGMRSKIMAAKMVAAQGGSSLIGPGREPCILRRLFDGEMLGTFFLPRKERLQSRKHWIAYVLRPKGQLVLDSGACSALQERGKSLLPSGIVEVRGSFELGESVQCIDEQGRPVAVGLTNYNSDDIRKIRGLATWKIEEALGFKDSDEVIHRDNLVIV